MCKFNPKNDSRVIDPCMKNIIEFLQKKGIKTLSSCCGHGKYPMTIVIQDGPIRREIFHNMYLPRTKKFYIKDKQEVYFIPEISDG